MRKPDDKRGHGARIPIGTGARLRIGERTLEGETKDIGLGGVFFATLDKAKPGETGVIMRLGGEEGVAVRVAWVRGTEHPDGAGLGLEFKDAD